MTPEQIEKWRAEADAYAYEGYSELARMLNQRDRAWQEKRDTEFARLVAADTWERAAQCGERWIHKHRTDALETQDEGCDFVDGAQGVINDIRAAAAKEKS